MKAIDLAAFATWVRTTPLANDFLWSRDLAMVSEMDLTLFYARAGFKGSRELASEAIDKLQSALVLGAVNGQVPAAALHVIAHEPPQMRYTVDEFVDGLVGLRPARRAAVMFALHSHQDLDRVASLTWSEISRSHQLSSEAREVIRSRGKVRMLRLPYVFWEWIDDRTAAPLQGLRTSVEVAFRKTWPQLAYQFHHMLWISARADKVSFLDLAGEVADGQL